MKKPNEEIGKKLEALALCVIDDAESAEAAERLDGFKAVTSYYVSIMKIRAKIPLDDETTEHGTETFGKIAARLKAVS